MNKAQRKILAAAGSDLSVFADAEQLLTTQHEADETVWHAVASKLDDLRSIVESVRDEEHEKYDNMPEGLQGSERGETMNEGIDALSSALDRLDEAVALASDDEVSGSDDPDDKAEAIADFVQEAVDELNNF